MSGDQHVRLDDASRLAALRETELLDSAPEEGFDRLTRLAATVLGVPVSLVSLVDADRQFFKSGVGLPAPWADRRGTALTHSFCQHVVTTGEPFVVDDARTHPLVRDNAAIDDLGVIAYAGVPIRAAGGAVLGAFCAIDGQPRQWTARDVEILRSLSAAVTTEIELHAALRDGERRRLDAEREHREKLAIMESANEGIYAVDGDGRCTFANRGAAELLGWTPAELIGRNMHDLAHHSHADGTPYAESDCPLFAALRGGSPVHLYGETLWRRDGRPFMVDCSAAPLRADGEIRGAVVTFLDVTEQQEADREQRFLADAGRVLASSLDYETTLQTVARLALPDLADMCLVDLVRDGETERVAAAHADPALDAEFQQARAFPPRLASETPQAVVIRSGEPLLVGEFDDAWRAGAARSAEHAEFMRRMEMRSLVVAPLIVGGRTLGTLTLVRTARRPAFDARTLTLVEEVARRAALAMDNARLYLEARTATRARDDMLGIVSHDLRNPIHTIYMAAAFIAELLPDHEPWALPREQARIAKRAAERANRLIGDLLDVTRMAAGRLEVVRRPVAAAVLLAEFEDGARPQAAEKGIALEVALPPADLLVLADRERVVQLLGNLFGNALKFTPAGGTVRIVASPDGGAVRFAVSDTGSGIAPENLPRLFDRYWQGERADRRGVGLGLSIVKGIVEAHEGRVWVESAPGRGSTFTFTLPCAREDEPRDGVRARPAAVPGDRAAAPEAASR